MPMGPVEYIEIACPGHQFNEALLPALQELVAVDNARVSHDVVQAAIDYAAADKRVTTAERQRRTSMRRRGPGLVRTMGRTAAIVGTATVTSAAVGGAVQQSAMQQQAATQQQAAAAQQQAAENAPEAAMLANKITQLQQLGDLKASGVISDEEFEQMKAKVLAQ